ncbi:phage head spike fiber domain-containing protein [Paraburkholderia caribensis]|uniref:phage head spike fiber domain-containing protein n=1 Tax=Paraburkholderia caribensis TaxID=75105 RepID=UPI0028644381|nr:hypothetical protein [Paraburkholderia caribensis]MDR6384252.1 hypothetical protein [Paraburkholderia caribensis]
MIGAGLSIDRRRRPAVVRGSPFAFDFINAPFIPASWNLSRSSVATYYGTDGLIHTAAPNVARFDADPLSHAPRGLLIEPQRANLIPYSNFPAGWATNGSPSSTQGVAAPDGSTNGARIATATTGTGYYSQSNVQTNTVYTASVFVRLVQAGTTSSIVMLGKDGGIGNVNFDLATHAVQQLGSSVVAWGYDPLQNGWLRLWVAYNSGTLTKTATVVYGAAGMVFDAWGADLEQGCYPSSVIATNGAGVTRAADLMTTRDMSAINPTEGTFVFDGAFNGVSGGGMFAFSLDDGVNYGIGIYKVLGSGFVNAYSSGATGTSTGVAVSDGERFRAGISYRSQGLSAITSINGAAARTISTTGKLNPLQLSIGSAHGAFNACTLTRSLSYWPYAMGSAELAAATRLIPPTL